MSRSSLVELLGLSGASAQKRTALLDLALDVVAKTKDGDLAQLLRCCPIRPTPC